MLLEKTLEAHIIDLLNNIIYYFLSTIIIFFIVTLFNALCIIVVDIC